MMLLFVVLGATAGPVTDSGFPVAEVIGGASVVGMALVAIWRILSGDRNQQGVVDSWKDQAERADKRTAKLEKYVLDLQWQLIQNNIAPLPHPLEDEEDDRKQ